MSQRMASALFLLALTTRAHAADPWKGQFPRPEIPGGYGITNGPIIHPYCLKRGQMLDYTRDQMAAGIDLWIRETIDRVNDQCRTDFPELAPYLDEWYSQALRTVITCSEQQTEFAAWTPETTNKAKAERVIPAAALEGLELNDRPLVREHRPLIVMNADYFTTAISPKALPAERRAASETLIHELFHTTSANNRYDDHAQLQSETPQPKSACSTNVLTDRISVLASLCTGQGLIHDPQTTASEALFTRISQCGMKHGCSDVFTSTLVHKSAPTRELASAALAPSAVESLCARIADEGFCRSTRKAQADTLASGSEPLRALKKPLADRLGQLWPAGAAGGYSAELARAFSSAPVFKSIASLESQSPRCFASAFSRDSAGNVTFVAPSDVRDQACTGVAVGPSKILAQLVDFNTRLKTSRVFKPVQARSEGSLETLPLDWERDSYSASERSDLEALLGETLARRYLETLEQHHPRSRRFDCQASGLGHYWSAHNAIEALKRIEQGDAGPSCLVGEDAL